MAQPPEKVNRSKGGKNASVKGGASMAQDKKPHDWNKEQPHHVDTGRITTEDYARKHPNKVEWVKGKKPK